MERIRCRLQAIVEMTSRNMYSGYQEFVTEARTMRAKVPRSSVPRCFGLFSEVPASIHLNTYPASKGKLLFVSST